MLNGVLGVMSLIFDQEYENDIQYFEKPAKYADTLTQTEWDVLLNYRAYVRELECILPDCDEPIWAIESEVITGWDRLCHIGIGRLLVRYTCSSNHNHQYEAIPLYVKQFQSSTL